MIIKNEFGKMPGPDIRPLLLKLQLFKSLLISFVLNLALLILVCYELMKMPKLKRMVMYGNK